MSFVFRISLIEIAAGKYFEQRSIGMRLRWLCAYYVLYMNLVTKARLSFLWNVRKSESENLNVRRTFVLFPYGYFSDWLLSRR